MCSCTSSPTARWIHIPGSQACCYCFQWRQPPRSRSLRRRIRGDNKRSYQAIEGRKGGETKSKKISESGRDQRIDQLWRYEITEIKNSSYQEEWKVWWKGSREPGSRTQKVTGAFSCEYPESTSEPYTWGWPKGVTSLRVTQFTEARSKEFVWWKTTKEKLVGRKEKPSLTKATTPGTGSPRPISQKLCHRKQPPTGWECFERLRGEQRGQSRRQKWAFWPRSQQPQQHHICPWPEPSRD